MSFLKERRESVNEVRPIACGPKRRGSVDGKGFGGATFLRHRLHLISISNWRWLSPPAQRQSRQPGGPWPSVPTPTSHGMIRRRSEWPDSTSPTSGWSIRPDAGNSTAHELGGRVRPPINATPLRKPRSNPSHFARDLRVRRMDLRNSRQHRRLLEHRTSGRCKIGSGILRNRPTR